MSTVDKVTADKIVAANGRPYREDPPIERIVEYTNAWGAKAYGFTTRGQDPNRYLRPTHFIRAPKVYWERKE